MSRIHFGVAYYDEYMHQDRLDRDIAMMLAAGIDVVRIAESTWSTLQPAEDRYDFRHVDRVLDAMHRAGIGVIVGTPTYAVPWWLAKKHPDILVTTPEGRQVYGRRQIIDIIHPDFREYAEKVIRRLLEHVCRHPGVIGYQVDNETKHYGNVGEPIQKAFRKSLQTRFRNIRELNDAFGLDYWSNRIESWDDFPPVQGTINASLGCAFARFRREQVAEYLAWQAAIVREYAQPQQFITQNFDFEWRGHSFGLQPQVDHFAAARALSVASVDVYHPTQDHLSGREIAFSGDVARNLKGGRNYYVMETQAQGFAKWTPYPGQLRLQAFSHIASGAGMVGYWHWHSIHNAYETYWKGLLSHDFSAGPTYREAATIGTDLIRLADTLDGLRIENDVAMLVSSDAMEAMNWFKPDTPQPEPNRHGEYIYNDIVRHFWDALYERNVGTDIIDHIDPQTGKYRLIIIPALYSASDEQLEGINEYVENGGRVLIGFKSGFCDENVQVRTSPQPGVIGKCCGVSYSQFTIPEQVGLVAADAAIHCRPDERAEMWMELLSPASERTRVLLRYDHRHWGEYAAATVHDYGAGQALYVGFLPSKELVYRLFSFLAAGITLQSVTSDCRWPVVVRKSTNQKGESVRFVFNYSGTDAGFTLAADVREPLTGNLLHQGQAQTIEPWGLRLFVEEG